MWKLLMAHPSADCNARSPEGRTALFYAVNHKLIAAPHRYLNARILAEFCNFFRGFRKFLEVFVRVSASVDPFGPVQTHSYTFGCIWIRSDAFGQFQKILKILRWVKLRFFCMFRGDFR